MRTAPIVDCTGMAIWPYNTQTTSYEFSMYTRVAFPCYCEIVYNKKLYEHPNFFAMKYTYIQDNQCRLCHKKKFIATNQFIHGKLWNKVVIMGKSGEQQCFAKKACSDILLIIEITNYQQQYATNTNITIIPSSIEIAAGLSIEDELYLLLGCLLALNTWMSIGE